MPLSNSQFGGSDSYSSMAMTPNVETPLSLSKSTFGSANQATAWKNKSLGGGSPLSLSSKTMGTTFNWDDTSSAPSVPQSDRGAGRNA
jgi:hypothetical protein